MLRCNIILIFSANCTITAKHARLKFADFINHFSQSDVLTVFSAYPAGIKPHNIKRTVFGAQFHDLILCKGNKAFPLCRIIFWYIGRPSALHDSAIRIIMPVTVHMPVRFGKICRNSYIFCSECVKQIMTDVGIACIMVRAIICRYFIIRKLTVKHAEAIMMFCCKNHIFHSGFFCIFRPLVRFKPDRVEGLIQRKILSFEFFSCHIPVNAVS